MNPLFTTPQRAETGLRRCHVRSFRSTGDRNKSTGTTGSGKRTPPSSSTRVGCSCSRGAAWPPEAIAYSYPVTPQDMAIAAHSCGPEPLGPSRAAAARPTCPWFFFWLPYEIL